MLKLVQKSKDIYFRIVKSNLADKILSFQLGGVLMLYIAMTCILSHAAYIESIGINHIFNVLILWIIIVAVGFFLHSIFKILHIRGLEFIFLLSFFTVILQEIMDYATPVNDNYLYLLIVAFLVSVFFLGGFISFFIKNELNRIVNSLCIILFLAFPLFVLIFSISPGEENKELEKYLEDYQTQQLEISNEYDNDKFYYGSGKDRYRKWYGKNVDYKTYTIDAEKFLTEETDKIFDFSMDFLFGIDKEHIPLNGIAYYPKKDTESKIVIFVHGMHDMYDYSEFGYEYMLNSLSKQGYIAVSIDENFLNSSFLGNYEDEEDMRALLILEHIKLLKKMNEDKNSLLYNKIDFEDITIVGHSRGGEAVYTAAYLNEKKYLEEADTKLNYNFDIANVVALAPTDKRYLPDGEVPVLENVNYLVFQGANDADVDKYYAYNAYSRNVYSDDEFHLNMGLYFYGANHGQFNTTWGRKDSSAPFKNAMLITANLMPLESQKKILENVLSVFLDITIDKKLAKLKYITDFEDEFKKYLYNTRYLITYDYTNLKNICDFELNYNFEDTNEVYIDETYSKEDIKRFNKALYIDAENYLTTSIESDEFSLKEKSSIYIDIASMDTKEIQNVEISLIDAEGNRTTSKIIEILPTIPVKMIKWPLFERLKYEDKYEYCFETFQIKRTEFSANESFNYNKINKIEISNAKKIIVDNLRMNNFEDN